MIGEKLRRGLLIVFFATLIGSAFAQDEQVQRANDDLLSPWVLSIDSGTLVLKVNGVSKKGDNQFKLDASFGFIGNPLKPVDAEAQYVEQGRELKFVTSSGMRYQILLKADGSHFGTYVGPRGSGSVLTIERISESELQSTIELGTKEPEVAAPDKDVPIDCSVFSGAWTGHWNGDANLWVTTVDKECQATYLYAKKGWRTRGRSRILGQKLTFQAAKATFEFTHNGQHLLGTYRPSEGTNLTLNADFTRK